MKQLIWHPSAIDEMQQIINYCRNNFGKETAKKVRSELNHDTHLLRTQPKLGYPESELSQTIEGEVRSLLSGYTKIVYSIHDNYIYIHLLWDTRRNPNDLNKQLTQRP